MTLVVAAVRFWPLTLAAAAVAYLWRGSGGHGLVAAGLLVAVVGWAVLAWLRLLAPAVLRPAGGGAGAGALALAPGVPAALARGHVRVRADRQARRHGVPAAGRLHP